MPKSIKVNAIPTTNSGMAILNLSITLSCLSLKASAIVSLALLKAVSPEDIGQATTPNIANTAPTFPITVLEIVLTTVAGPPAFKIPCNPFVSPKKDIAAAAQTKAITPSAIIAP